MKYFLSLLFLFLFYCTSTKSIVVKDDSIVIKKLESWINLMPGGKPTFHYSGEIEIRNIDAEKIEIDHIEFLTDQKIINKSFPIYEFSNEVFANYPKVILINFYSPQNIKVTEEMLKSEFIDARLKIKIDDESIEIIHTDIYLLRTY